MACQFVWGYFMPKGYGIAFIVRLYLYFCTVIWHQVFLSNTNNLHTVLCYQVFLSNTNNLHTVEYHVFQSNTPRVYRQLYGFN